MEVESITKKDKLAAYEAQVVTQGMSLKCNFGRAGER